MPTTIEQVHSMLRAEGMHPFTDNEDSLVLIFEHRGQMLHIHVQVLEDGQYVRWWIPFFLRLTRGPHRAAVMQKLLNLNYTFKLIKYGVDVESNQITVEADMPLHETPLTSTVVQRLLSLSYELAMKHRDGLKRLAATGTYPPESELSEVDTVVQHLLEGMEEPGPVTDEPSSEAAPPDRGKEGKQ